MWLLVLTGRARPRSLTAYFSRCSTIAAVGERKRTSSIPELRNAGLNWVSRKAESAMMLSGLWSGRGLLEALFFDWGGKRRICLLEAVSVLLFQRFRRFWASTKTCF